ncbi:MAG: SAM-dependent methyltransferase [Candidatus Pelagibacter sp. TMED273]|nr:MAG: SAM-dependent methyltransferase [Candidatus Pelagibacter sp. TMED273]|tara:strand:+ start:8253 stop:8963 length:711 start_codon:yes stop_codon:yes gene_type:complete
MIKKFIPLFIKLFFKRMRDFLTWDQWINQSYSQEGEDMVLKRIFGDKKKVFYVDVGAHHPKRFSNTYLLYKNGSKGINIDASPGSMKLFNKLRPGDINIEIGVSAKKGELDYYVFNEPALNSFSKELSEKIDKEKNLFFIKKVIKVKVERLDKILDNNLIINEIDFFNIDVEGLDFDVLQSNDWSKYRPKFVLVEILGASLHVLDEHPIVKFMREKDYEIYAKQVNTMFFKEKNYN